MKNTYVVEEGLKKKMKMCNVKNLTKKEHFNLEKCGKFDKRR